MNTPLTIWRAAAIVLSLVIGVAAFLRRRRIPALEKGADGYLPAKKKRRNLLLLGAALLWLACGLIIGLFTKPSAGLHVQMMAPRMDILGFDVSSSAVISWGVIGVLTVLAVLFRLFAVPKFQERPKGIQAVMETVVTFLDSYTKEKSATKSDALNAYMLALALFMVGCAVAELFSLRPPTADLVLTLSMALITFVMINYYGLRKKGLGGRLRSIASPTPIVFPFRLLSDIAIPVSLACRLFGNMLGGMIVIHLVYMALGAFGVGIPAVLGLYFNMFHPLIQVFIFITLSLTFIGEAVE